MAKRFVAVLPDGHRNSNLAIFTGEGVQLAKAMFAVSRTTDMTTSFDPEQHTLHAIAAGLAGHIPLLSHECEDTDLPSDRYFRDAWEWSD